MARWPHDDPASLAAFYGDPGKDEPGRQLVPVIPPFQMYYDGRPIKKISFHRKAANALAAALNDIWEYCGRDQKKIDASGISKFSGAYNRRKVRGSATKWSNHAYGAAIDFDAERNGFNTGHGTIPQFVVDAFKRQGALWGGDYKGRTDPMHFEFCSRGEAAAKPAAPAATQVAPTLRRGSRSEYVKLLQGMLGFAVADIDGDFGPKTEAALKKYQAENGLVADGICGPQVWKSLNP